MIQLFLNLKSYEALGYDFSRVFPSARAELLGFQQNSFWYKEDVKK